MRTARSGDDDSVKSGLRAWRTDRGLVAHGVFPPEDVAQVKALACELPRTHGVPLSRFTGAELHRLVVERGITDASASTILRWLGEDLLKPWQHRSWVFPTDPEFADQRVRAPLERGRRAARMELTSEDLAALLARLSIHDPVPRLAA
jgi:hypothetical protein